MEAKKRFTFIDLLKGWALIVMIEVHVVNAFILPELKITSWFSVLNFINGLVAPSFTFISGFAFIISSKNNIEELRKFGSKFWKKLSRILLIFLIGYGLHMPEFSFQNIIHYASYEEIVKWYNVDVLQCIGFSLLVLFFARIFIKSDKHYNYFILITTILIIAISPFIWNTDFANYVPMPIACYFNGVHGSFFPLFPWMGFLFAGAYACILYMKFRKEEKEEYFINKMMLFSGIAFIVSFIVLSFLQLDPRFEIKPNPFFFFERLGLVMVALGLCWLYVKKAGENISFVTDVSRESLLIYFLHLQVIYRKIWWHRSMVDLIDFKFGVMECIYASLILIAAMVTVAKLWGRFKVQYPKVSPVVSRAVITALVILFFYLT